MFNWISSDDVVTTDDDDDVASTCPALSLFVGSPGTGLQSPGFARSPEHKKKQLKTINLDSASP